MEFVPHIYTHGRLALALIGMVAAIATMAVTRRMVRA